MATEDTAVEAAVTGENSGDNVRASWPFSLHTLRTNLSHCSPEGREAIIGAFLWCTDTKHAVHREEFARRVQYAANTIYKVCAGKYRAPDGSQLDVPADLVRNIKQFLAIEQERFVGDKNEFVVTPTVRRIWTACDLARESQTPVFLYGRSHVGKTWALEAYTRQNNHGRTAYCRMKAAAGLGGMVRRMATSIGVSPDSNTASLVDRIKRAMTPDMLLILDEVHLLAYTYRRSSFFACLEVIREIYDEVRCGFVLCGTTLLLDRMQEGARGELEQLMRRGVHRCSLPTMPTKADISAILKRSGLEFPAKAEMASVQGIEDKPYDILRQLAKESGLLAITERLRYGRKLAARRKTELGWEHFVEAHLTIAAQGAAEEPWN